MINNGGVYEIKNITNGKQYIGSAINFKCRWKRHRSDLNKNIHGNIHLQRAWNKYSYDMFEFKILIVCDKQNNVLYEQTCMDKMNPKYNIAPIAGSQFGLKRSAETCEKISEALKGKKLSEEHKRKLCVARKGRVISEETKRKIGRAHKGKKTSVETKGKISKALTGNKNSLGYKHTKETKLKMSVAGKAYWASRRLLEKE